MIRVLIHARRVKMANAKMAVGIILNLVAAVLAQIVPIVGCGTQLLVGILTAVQNSISPPKVGRAH